MPDQGKILSKGANETPPETVQNINFVSPPESKKEITSSIPKRTSKAKKRISKPADEDNVPPITPKNDTGEQPPNEPPLLLSPIVSVNDEKNVWSAQPEVGMKQRNQTEKKAGQTLELVEGANILKFEEEEEQFVDPMQLLQHYQAAHIALIGQKGKRHAWQDEENPTEEYLQKVDRLRLEKLRYDRGRCLSSAFCLIFHIIVIFNFVHSWIDSFKISMQNAKLQTYHLQGVFNCMEIVQNANAVQFLVEIFHALMSACVLFADTRANACLCMGFVFAQGVHTVYKGFQFFMHVRFLNGWEELSMGTTFLIILVADVVASIVVMQRFYDLTDRIRTRAKFVAANVDKGGSMNDEIIYQNQSPFLQRKYILRQAVASQVFRVIQKIERYTEKGIKPDYISIYRELHAAKQALKDVDNVQNEKLIKELRKASAKRLKELEKIQKFSD